MINNIKKRSRKDDIRLLSIIIFAFIIVAWLCSPPGNKFLQIMFWGNNTQMFISKLTGNYSDEYKFHRNNAVYLAKMFPDDKRAIKEIDKAIKMAPSYISDNELKTLYRDRAYIKLYLGDRKGALSDFMNSGQILFADYIKIAILFKEAGNYKEAAHYCSEILKIDSTAYSGYACLADVYDTIGRPDVAINIYNLGLDRRKNFPQFLVDRALLYKELGNMEAYNNDVEMAKKYNPSIKIENNFVKEALSPKMINLTIVK